MKAWLADLVGVPEAPNKPFPSAATQKNAQEVFCRMGGREFNYLADILYPTTNEGPSFAVVAAFKIGHTNADAAIPKLIGMFSGYAAPGAAACLAGIGPDAIPFLLKALTDKDVQVRRYAIIALGEFGPSAKPAIPLLLKRYKKEETAVRANILITLGQIGQDPGNVVPILVQCLKSDEPVIRGNSIFALGEFGDNAMNAAPELFKLLRDDDANVRNNAATVIMRLNLTESYIPNLVSNVVNPDPAVRSLIAQALGKQEHTNEVFAALLKLTNDPDRYVRESAGVTLNQIGYKPPVNVNKLRGLNQ